MKKIPLNKKLVCDGPCPFEALTYPSGTLSDGTTYNFTASAGATVNDLGSGTIEFGSADPTLTVTFSAPVDLQFTNAVSNSVRTVWHGTATRYTRAITDGSPWCYNPGSVNLPLNLLGTEVNAQSQSGTNANSDWGQVITFNTTTVDIRSYVWDTYNFEARPRSIECELPVCEVVDDLKDQVKSLQTAVPTEIPEHIICTGPFIDCTNRSGWIGSAGTVHTTNSGSQTLFGWTKVGGSGVLTSPDCLSDMKVDLNLGHIYFYLRRMRAYFWVDVRLLVNGVVVTTQTVDKYLYTDARDNTPLTGTAPLELNLNDTGNTQFCTYNVDPNSVIEAEAQVRYNFNGAQQPNAYGRIIRWGLRSKVSTIAMPRNILTGVV